MKNEMIYRKENHLIIVNFIGDIDSHNVSDYRMKLNKIIADSREDIVFDFSKTLFIDSSGIGLILGRYNQLKVLQRTLIVTGLNPVAYRLFDLTGLFQIIPYYHTIDTLKEGIL